MNRWLVSIEVVSLTAAVIFGVMWLRGGNYEPHAALAGTVLAITEVVRRVRSEPQSTESQVDAGDGRTPDSNRTALEAASGRAYPPELRVDTLPAERVDARANSPREISDFVGKVPPLNRRQVADEVYRGKWVVWSGTIASIQDREYCISVLVEGTGGGLVILSFAPWERTKVAAHREGDAVRFEGQITRAADGIELVRVSFLAGGPTSA